MTNLKHLAIIAAVVTTAALSLPMTTKPAQAQSVSCAVVEALGRPMIPTIVNEINSSVAGTSHRISRRKSLLIHRTRSLGIEGCQVNASFDVTLRRKIRRNAHGQFRIAANVVSVARDRICLSNVRVTNINLSRTLRIGEAVYRGVANRAIPNNQCFSL